MGGWRCSYHNCTLRSDGKTHMFHYPVFDKVRCHQWLINCGRLDFLSLKVSQLKNRVVCQHHFKDDNFMNFKRDKLTFDAVPTENGPFCDANVKEHKPNEYSIIIDDIENEYMTLNDKKANYSVKYADFLTSNELTDLGISNYFTIKDTSTDRKTSTQKYDIEIPSPNNRKTYSTENKNNDTSAHKSKLIFEDSLKINSDMSKSYSTVHTHNRSQTPPVLVVPPYHNNENEDHKIILEVDLTPFSDVNYLRNNTDDNMLKANKIILPHPKSSSTPILAKQRQNKIKILSEKKISEPVTITGKLEPIATTSILPLPNKEKNDNPVSLNNELYLLKSSTCSGSLYKNENKCPELQTSKLQKTPKKIPEAVMKNKVTPERIAAIESKRNFNKKLRDTIETFLDKMDEQDKVYKTSESETDVQKEDRMQNVMKNKKNHVQDLHGNISQKQKRVPSKDCEVPAIQDYTIAYLESRIKKMEDALINKIDQNSHKIVELKRSVEQQTQKRKTVSTQTILNKEADKKRLYKEISKYLSPSANNIVYEELFLNKYGQQPAKVSSPSPKRKKRR